MTYNAKAIEEGQAHLALGHKQRMIARQAEIDSVEIVIMRSDAMEIIKREENDFPAEYDMFEKDEEIYPEEMPLI